MATAYILLNLEDEITVQIRQPARQDILWHKSVF